MIKLHLKRDFVDLTALCEGRANGYKYKGDIGSDDPARVYFSAHTTRQYICGSKTIADIHRDYEQLCLENNQVAVTYACFDKVFNEKYNISFFVPKKDKCIDCTIFDNSTETEKEPLQEEHDTHLKENELAS